MNALDRIDSRNGISLRVMRWMLAALTAATAAALAATSIQAATPEDEVLILGRRAFANRVLARLRAEGSVEAVERALKAIPGARILRVSGLVSGLVEIDPGLTIGGIRPQSVPAPLGSQLAARIDVLRATGLFDYVEPDSISTLLGQPTDNWQSTDLWGLRNLGTNGLAGVDIDAVRAWNFVSGKPEVVVAVLDSGIRTTHRELAPNLWVNSGEIPGNGIDDDGDGFVDDVNGVNLVKPDAGLIDDNGHGTHVAGTIAASGTNGEGLVGVAWGCRIMGIKAADEKGRFATARIIQGLEYAVRHGARIVNASFAGTSFSQAEYDAFAAANAAGVLVICAAGNEGQNNDTIPHFPASYRLPNLISVAAVNRYGGLAEFSNYGVTSVDLAAPGVGIVSCGNASDEALRTLDGTSMAAPHVSGVAALLLSVTPRTSVPELRQRLIHSSVPLPSLTGKVGSGGVVNAFRALILSQDGIPSFELRPLNSAALVQGLTNTVEITATDFHPLAGGSLAVSGVGPSEVLFRDDGVLPDRVSGDGVFTGFAFTTNSGPTLLSLSTTNRGRVYQAERVVDLRKKAANDRFQQAIRLGASEVDLTGSNDGASMESGEPSLGSPLDGSSVWYDLIPAGKAATNILSVVSSEFAPIVTVYSGTSMNALKQVSIPVFENVASFVAEPSTRYFVRVASKGGMQGAFRLSLRNLYSQPNDSRLGATAVGGPSLRITANNAAASREVGEPVHAGNKGGKSLWWKYLPPESGNLTVDTRGSDFDTLLAAYDANYTSIAENDDEVGVLGIPMMTSRVAFRAEAGVPVWVVVDGWTDGVNPAATGNIVLNFRLKPDTNDSYNGATELFAGAAPISDSNVGATAQGGELKHNGSTTPKSRWYRWTAPVGGRATVRLAPITVRFNGVLAVYNGPESLSSSDDWNKLVLVNSASDTNSVGTSTVFDAFAGKTYHFVVDGFAEGILFPQTDAGSYSIGVSTTGSVGNLFSTDVDSGARETHVIGDSAVRYFNKGNQIGGANSLAFAGSSAINGKAAWYFNGPVGLKTGTTEISFRFLHRGGDAKGDGWALGFFVFPDVSDPTVQGSGSQFVAMAFDCRGTGSGYYSALGSEVSQGTFGVSGNQIHSFKCTIDASRQTATFALDGQTPESVAMDLPNGTGIGLGPAVIFVGGSANQSATLAIDDLTIKTFPRHLVPQLHASELASGIQLIAVGEPGESLVLEGSQDFGTWTKQLQTSVATNGTLVIPNLVPRQPLQFFRLKTL